jgi:hypothetical protein
VGGGLAGPARTLAPDAALCVLPLLHAHTTGLLGAPAGRVQSHHLQWVVEPTNWKAAQTLDFAPRQLFQDKALVWRQAVCSGAVGAGRAAQARDTHRARGGVEGRAARPVRVTSRTCQGRRRARCVKVSMEEGGCC